MGSIQLGTVHPTAKEFEVAHSQPYFLALQAHVCVANDTMFILDEASGKYLSLGKAQAEKLSPFIYGWPLESKTCSASPLLQSLLERNLITCDSKLGKPATPPTVQFPTVWMRDEQPRGCPKMTAKDLYRFSAAVTCALYSKKNRPFSKIISRVKRRAQKNEKPQPDTEKIASLVRIFDWLRPLAFKKTNECFLYCLALSEFLARYGIHPTWIFAVQAQPFAAHCWLQHGNQALTDIPFNLRRMVPILVI